MEATANDLVRASELHALQRGSAVAAIDGERQATWQSLHADVLKTVGQLRAQGLRAGDRVGYLGYNSLAFVVLMQACFRSGIVLVPLNWRLAPNEIDYLVQDSGVRLIFAGDEFRSLVNVASTPEIVSIGFAAAGSDQFFRWIADASPDASDASSDSARLALIIYTSGTTGAPKGACISLRNLVAAYLNLVSTGEAWGQWDDSVVLILSTPNFHIGGAGWAARALLGAPKLIILPRADTAMIVDAIPRHRVTRLCAVPAMLGMILDDPAASAADFSTVRDVIYGASPIPLDILKRSMRKFPDAGFVQLYGTTETTASATWLPADDHDASGNQRMKSCGKPYASTELKVVDARGDELPANEIGEVWVRSPTIMDQGYLGLPKATAETIRDGWYATGDAGFLDDDGYLYICDRIRDMICSGGENVYPAEVENALSTMPAIEECAVVGVPDARWGEAVKAVVVVRKGMRVTSEEIRAFLRGRIAGFKIPKSVDFVEILPRNGAGKILKREIRRPYWEGRERQVS